MIDLTNQMIYRIGNLDVQHERISYQMSTGKVLDRGSDDSVVYGKYLDIEDNLRTYEGLETQVKKTTAQNNVADASVGEMKLIIDSVKIDLLKSLNAGMSRSDKVAVATNISGMRENLITLANTQINGEFLFTGSNTTKQTFLKDDDYKINGKVNFQGNASLRSIAVERGVYRDRGITAHDVLMYDSDTSSLDNKISFNQDEIVIDENGNTWKLNNAENKLVKFNTNGTVSNDYLDVIDDGNTPKTFTSETLDNAKTNGHISSKTHSGLLLQTKHNIFDDLNVIINALKGYGTKNTDDANNGKQGAIIDDGEVSNVLSSYLEKISTQYDATNVGHAKLGGRNKIFNTSLDNLSTKIVHFNILMQETNGADLAKLAMESKSLEMTYSALSSTVSKMNELSLINFLK